ncbi:MAG: beta-lactamase family protein [Bauldia sp.]|nr:beta-lactamase family protein [Bauldia sp.]
MVRGIGYGKCAIVMASAMLLAACSDLGDLARLPARTAPEDVPSRRSAATAQAYLPTVEAAAAAVRQTLVDQNLPGLSVAVAVDGREVWAEGFGWADLRRGDMVTPETRFRVGDIAAPMTAVAAAVLAEGDVLDLDVPVQTYVAFPATAVPITTRQLMSSQSGLRDLAAEEQEMMRQDVCVDDTSRLAFFADDDLAFTPGTDARYSTYGWVLAGAMIGASAGEPYAAFIAREVFRPLGMTGTVPDQVNGGLPDVATLYYPVMMANTRRGLETASRVNLSCLLPAEGFLSTPSDMVRLVTGLTDGSLLKAETVDMLFTPATLDDGTSTDTALGWQVGSILDASGGQPLRFIGRAGAVFGGTATLLFLPEHHVVVAVATNVSWADTETVAGSIARLFAKARPAVP